MGVDAGGGGMQGGGRGKGGRSRNQPCLKRTKKHERIKKKRKKLELKKPRMFKQCSKYENDVIVSKLIPALLKNMSFSTVSPYNHTII